MKIGGRLRVARKQKGLSVRKLGEIVGVSGMAISKYERDLDMPSPDVLTRLCQALDLNQKRLFRATAVVLSVPERRDKPVIEQKPTLDQIAWVFKCLMQAWNDGGSYRHLLEVMEVDGQPGAYEKLLPGLEINNCLFEDHERRHPETP